MNIIIVGCGKVGLSILSSLVAEGHDVTVIDSRAASIAEITNIYDAMGVCGSGVDPETLQEAGVAKAQMFIAATGSDEMNMLSCFLAKRLGAEHTIARIRNPEYNDKTSVFLRQQLQLDLAVNPDLLAANELYNVLQLPSAAKLETFSRRRLEMVELRLKAESPLCGTPLYELRKKFSGSFLVGVVQRGKDAFIPDGSFVLQAGDRIGLIAPPQDLQKLLNMLDPAKKEAHKVMLLGASRVAYYLTRRLLSAGCTVTVIEKDADRCADFAERLPKAMVICGDGARQELLMEEGLGNADAFVALTGMDEENILMAIFAESKNVSKAIAKINRTELNDIAENLGLDSTVTPRQIVSDVVVQYARALENSMGSSVETLYKLMDEQVEALEFTVRADFAHVNVPLKDMKLKKNTLLGGIIRGRKAIMPTGDDVLMPGDQVVVLAAGQRLQSLSDMME